jgi:hypothetical protein
VSSRVNSLPYLGLLFLAQLELKSTQVLLQVGGLGGTRDRDEVRSLGQDPGKGELSNSASLNGSELLNLINQSQRLVEVLLNVVAGDSATEVILGEVVNGLVLSGQESTSKGRVRNDSDSELTASLENTNLLQLNVGEEGRVLDLVGGDLSDLGGTVKSGGRALGQSDVTDLSLLLESNKLGHGLLDRGSGVGTVLVVEVDVVGSKTLQGFLDGLADILPVSPNEGTVSGPVNLYLVSRCRRRRRETTHSELGGKEDLGTLSGLCEPLSKKVLIVLVDIGGVPEGQSKLVGTVKEGETLGVGRRRTVKGGESLSSSVRS